MIALVSRWKLLAGVGAALVATLMLLVLQGERHGRAKAEAARARAEAELVAARSQAALEQAASAAAAAVQTRAVRIITRSEETAHAIRDLPGAEQPLPDAVRNAWAHGVLGLRRSSPAAPNPGRAGG